MVILVESVYAIRIFLVTVRFVRCIVFYNSSRVKRTPHHSRFGRKTCFGREPTLWDTMFVVELSNFYCTRRKEFRLCNSVGYCFIIDVVEVISFRIFVFIFFCFFNTISIQFIKACNRQITTRLRRLCSSVCTWKIS